MKLSTFSVRHPAIITIILVAVVLFGVLALLSLSQDLISEISLPGVVVHTLYPGASPETMEEEITDILEDQFNLIAGINSISSSSSPSVSSIQIFFNENEDLDDRINDVRDAVNNAMADLPEEIQGMPRIFRISSGMFPIFTVTADSSMEPARLSRYIRENVVPRLSRIPGMASCFVRGDSREILEIALNPEELAAKEIAVLDVYQALQYNNLTFPAGDVIFESSRLNMRTEGEYSSLQEVEGLVVGFKEEEQSAVRLKDVARIARLDREPEVRVTAEGQNAVSIDLIKQSSGDTLKIIRQAKEVLRRVEKETGGVIAFSVIGDFSGDIRLAMSSVRGSLLLGALLAVFIIFLFLHNIRATIIIGFSMPLSVMLAFTAMYLRGQSLNLMTLGGMTVAIGMIVDSSIVILENTVLRFQGGLNRKEAAIRGAGEVGGAIIASTSTSLAVFIPLLFIGGIAGSVLEDVSLVIIYALAASLLSAIILVPFLSSLLLEAPRQKRALSRRLAGGVDRVFHKLERLYKGALFYSLSNRGFIIFFSVALLILSLMTVSFLGFEFISPPDMNELEVRMTVPKGFTREETARKLERLEGIIRDEIPEVRSIASFSGLEETLSRTGSPNHGILRVRIVEHKDRQRDIFAVINQLQRILPARVPDVEVTVANSGISKMISLGVGGEGLVIEVTGSDFSQVYRSARTIQDLLAQDPSVNTSEHDVDFNQQELVQDLSMDYMGTLGITPYEAGITTRALFNGMEMGTFTPDTGSRVPIRLTSTLEGETVSEDLLGRLTLRSQSGRFISFANFSELEVRETVNRIPRKEGMKAVTVTTYLNDSDLRGIQNRVLPRIEAMAFPEGVSWQVSGSAELMAESFRSLLIAMGIAVFLVYMVMVIQFEHFAQPLIIMASIPFTLVGVVSGLLAFGSTLSLVSFMGLIALAGIVVNNAIVLIDHINTLRKQEGRDLVPAILEGCSRRLRPILMTTMTTILGVIPMALGIGEGSEIYAPLGQAIGGGLITSTLITIFLIPTLYYILEEKLIVKEKRHERAADNPLS